MTPALLDLLKSLGPPFITVALGGVFAAFLVPRWQQRNDRARLYAERRLAIAEKVAEAFTLYVIAWRRLIAISQAGDEVLTPEQRELKRSFVQDRNDSRAALHAALNQAMIYFDHDVFASVEDFMRWDDAQFALALEDLPPIEAWTDWQRRVVNHLKRGLGARG